MYFVHSRTMFLMLETMVMDLSSLIIEDFRTTRAVPAVTLDIFVFPFLAIKRYKFWRLYKS